MHYLDLLDFIRNLPKNLNGNLSKFPFKQGGIYIKPENKGKFTAKAKRAGKGVQEFANYVLHHKKDYSNSTIKQANFARNASKWGK